MLDGNHWKGVWFDDKTADEGDLFIYGGQVWRNLTGNIGIADGYTALNAPDWQLVPKSSFANHEYIEMQFSVLYDFHNDWIDQQYDSNDNKVGLPYSAKILLEEMGITFPNPVDISDWNMFTKCVFVNRIYTIFGFVNNEFTFPVTDITAAGIAGNCTDNFRNIHVWANTFEDFEMFTISNNKCPNMVNITSTQIIKDIPKTVEIYVEHTDDESFYCEVMDYMLPLSVGTPRYVNCILHQDVVITEMAIKGMGLTDTEGAPLSNTAATISVGIETDDPHYIPNTTLVTDINGSGVKVSTMSNPTTAPFRRIKVEVFGADIVEGKLKISGKYL